MCNKIFFTVWFADNIDLVDIAGCVHMANRAISNKPFNLKPGSFVAMD